MPSVPGLSPQIRILRGGEPRLLTDIGRVDPTSLDSYRQHGGYDGLERAVAKLGPEGTIAEIRSAQLRGRGGAGYPTADKWSAARDAKGDRKVVVANLMGADPTALGDRALAEGNPHLVLEGLLIAAFAVGASEAHLAVRRDWTLAIERLRAAIAEAEAAHLAGYLILGTDVSVQVSLWEGSGALVAGEETALLAALWGDRGMPIIRPPYPSETGFQKAPTVVQNAETLAHATWILAHSAEAFASVGSETSKGTKLVSIFGKVAEPGLVEVPMGISLMQLLTAAGGGIGSTKALFIGGAGGGAIDAASFDMAYDFDTIGAAGAVIGSGSILVTDADTCMVDTARFFLDHSAREACGKAVPCRIGTKRLVETLDRILAATPRPNDFQLLRDLSRKMRDTALCHLESRAPGPMLTTLERFPDEYRAHAERGVCLAGSCQTGTLPPLLSPLSGVEPVA
ncbi:MAG TPA: NADH-ubiquinone oxidoreductase-F iron-sulfur binding region domain-containing protein [Candidatus Limnocylindria bacterium]|jgi:NADH-quinone oxidoreductase subunit F|nr:NADH-ubiquinone oxidoreductase-F iron-sulfur binding region domain-containing protein [Candidatus Limnocylindria bacterium]